MGSSRFSILTPNCLRVEWAPDGRFVDEPSLFATARAGLSVPPPARCTVPDSAAEPVRLTGERLIIDYRPDGLPPHAARGGRGPALTVRLRESERASRDGYAPVEWSPGLVDDRNLGGAVESLDNRRGPDPGSTLAVGILSRRGWGLADDSSGHLLVDDWVACRDWLGYAKSGPDGSARIDWYLFMYGEDYGAALRSLALVSGPVPLPRRSALGSWFSRYWPYTSAEYREILRDYERYGFPLDMMVLDMDWHSASTDGRWTGWSWNRRLLPDAEALLSDLHAEGLKVSLNLHPAEGVGPGEERYDAFMRRLGADPGTRDRIEFDAGNKAYMRAIFDEMLAPLEAPEGDAGASAAPTTRAQGVDFWWLDWQQERFVRSVPGLTNLAWLNRLFFEHSRAGTPTQGRAEGWMLDQGVSRRRGLNFSRFAGLGDHRHPIHFSGDAHTGWEMLAYQVAFSLASAGSGCFFWSHDIGGHFGPRNDEALTRWIQFGALSAALRLHSARQQDLDRRPWLLAEPFRAAAKRAFDLRAVLFPSIYTAAWRSSQGAEPLLRPMWWDYPGCESAYTCPHQYMLGDDVLVAPVVSPGEGPDFVATRAVWFPPPNSADEDASAGAQSWFNLTTGEHVVVPAASPDGRYAWIGAAIDEIPVIARAGPPLFLQPATARMSGVAAEPTLIVRLFPPATVGPNPGPRRFERILYEDDGESDGYRRGEHGTTRVVATWTPTPGRSWRLHLEVAGTVGAYAEQPPRRRIVIEIGAAPERTDLGLRDMRESVTFEASVPMDAAADDERGARRRLEREMRRTRDSDDGARPRIPTLAGSAPRVEELERRAARLRAVDGIGVASVDPGPCAAPATGAARTLLIHPYAKPGETATVQIVDVLGRTESLMSEQTVEFTGAAQGGTEGDGPIGRGFVEIALPGDPWRALKLPPVGLVARRVAVVRTRDARGEAATFAQELLRAQRPVTLWLVHGPFSWDWRRPVTEQRAGPEPGSHEAAAWRGRDGHPVAPRVSVRGPAWACDLRRTLTNPGEVGASGLAYARALLVSAVRQPARIRIELPDKGEAWLNGRKVLTQDGAGAPIAWNPVVECELEAGENTMLVKCADGWGQWGFNVFVECESALAEVDQSGHGAEGMIEATGPRAG
jgi:alpha-glucosidase (family GH31 glycosyl hydrolase)